MIKGLKCNVCGYEFHGKDAINRKTQGLNTLCMCPRCNERIMSKVSASNIVLLIAFAIIFFTALFLSIIYSTTKVSLTIGGIGFISSYIIPRFFFPDGYLQMFKYDYENENT